MVRMEVARSCLHNIPLRGLSALGTPKGASASALCGSLEPLRRPRATESLTRMAPISTMLSYAETIMEIPVQGSDMNCGGEECKGIAESAAS
jgi:hypothetical protein